MLFLNSFRRLLILVASLCPYLLSRRIPHVRVQKDTCRLVHWHAITYILKIESPLSFGVRSIPEHEMSARYFRLDLAHKYSVFANILIFIILGILTNQIFNKFILPHPATECRKKHSAISAEMALISKKNGLQSTWKSFLSINILPR